MLALLICRAVWLPLEGKVLREPHAESRPGKARMPSDQFAGKLDDVRETDVSSDDVLRADQGGVERIRNATESLFFMLFLSLNKLLVSYWSATIPASAVSASETAFRIARGGLSLARRK
ncbi:MULTISPECIES: hypothetical protein [unclassified Bradyrhizobium]|jgi:hypothetical protein|uniref:hypothetical protein n=1 Tax=unclassified Bradyrhizobium TaxID=2631580 RepID=UPI00104A024D|nr:MULTISPECIES: hypothetical protein [unclassified Bradyrhizobium]